MERASTDATALVAYIDESRKPIRDRRTGRVTGGGEHYVVAAAVLLAGDAEQVREHLVSLADEITDGRPLRWTDMSATRRVRAIEVVSQLDGYEFCLYETAEPTRANDAFVRGRILGAAFGSLSSNRDVEHAILETRSQPKQGFTTHDERDHRVLASTLRKGRVKDGFRIEHRGKDEPVLWLADILAGMRTDYLCWVDRGAFPLVGHMAAEIIEAL